MSTTKKPFGITATAVYSAFWGVIDLPIGLLLLFASAFPKGTILFASLGTLAIVLGVFLLASVYGLWSLQEWGRKLTIWLYGISIILGIIAIFPVMPNQQFTIANLILQLAGIGIAILIMIYLSKPHIKALFEPA
jgi:hypothetical protein